MSNRAVIVNALLADPTAAATVTREDAEALVVSLAAVVKALELRALRPPEPKPETPKPLTLNEVAQRTGKSLRWWREHWRVEIGAHAKRAGKTVLVPHDAVDAWLKRV